jgi:hypothetical protein
VFVDPCYRASVEPSGRPSVAVARAFDDRLSGNDPAKIKQVEAEIWADPGLNQAIFIEQLTSPYADRSAALREVMASIESDVGEEAEYINTPANLERLREARADSGAERMYCW